MSIWNKDKRTMKNSFVKRTIVTMLMVSVIPFAIFTAILIHMVQSFEGERLEDSLNMIISEKRQTMMKDLQKVESEVNNLAEWANAVEGYPADPAYLSPDYKRNAQNVLEAPGKESSTYLPSSMPLTPDIAVEIMQTEAMVPIMESMLQRNSELAHTYLVTARGFMRVFPYLDNQIFSPDHDQRTDPFYTIASPPAKENTANWTKAYYDYGGNGWVITCSQAYFRQDGTLGGVVCADVILDKLVQSVVDFRIGDSGFAFIIDKSGGVIYHPYMEDIKGNMGDTFQINYGENYGESSVRMQILKAMQDKEAGLVNFNEDGRKKAVVFERLDSIDWIIGIEIDKEEYSVGRESLTLGVWASLFVLLIVMSTLGSLLSRRIIAPILKLTEHVKNMDQGNLVPLPVNTSDEIGMLATAFNNMGQKISQYTEELIYSKNQLESVFNSIDDTMMILDSQYAVKKLNKGPMPIGEPCYKAVRGQETPCRNCPVGETVRRLNKHKAEVACQGDIFQVASYPVLDEEGQLKEIVVFEKSVTGEKLMEKELFQTEKMAVIGQMVAGATHELKTPLSVIKGAAFLLKDQVQAPESAEIMGEMDANIARAEKIVYNMLDFSKSSWGESQLHDSRKLLDQLYMLVRQECVTKSISVQIDTGDQPVTIFGNSDSLKNIFLNIMTNALEEMEEGGRLSIRAHYGEEGQVCILFRNTGRQIPEENLDKIFEPFFTTKERGTGLGLWLVQKEVIRSRGSIQVRNHPDGVEVEILLPGQRPGERFQEENR